MGNKEEFIPPRILLSQPTVNDSSGNNDNVENNHPHTYSFHDIAIGPLVSSSSSSSSSSPSSSSLSLNPYASLSKSQFLKRPRKRSISANRLSSRSLSTHEPYNDTSSLLTIDSKNSNVKKRRNSKDSMSRYSIFRSDDEDYPIDSNHAQHKISSRLSIPMHVKKKPNLSPLLIPTANSKNSSALQTPKSSKSGGLLPNVDGLKDDDDVEDLSYFLDEALSNSAWMPTKSTQSPLKKLNTSQVSINSSLHNLRKRKKPPVSDSISVSDIDLEEGRHTHQYKENIRLNDLNYNLPTINSVQYLDGLEFSSQGNTPDINQSPSFAAATGNNLDRLEPIEPSKSKRKSVTSMSKGKTFAKAFQKISNMVNADEGNIEDNDDDKDDNGNEDGDEVDDISSEDGNKYSVSNNVEMGSISSNGDDEYINMEFGSNAIDDDIESIATTYYQKLENSKLNETTITANATVQPFNLLDPFGDNHNIEGTIDSQSESVHNVQEESSSYVKSEGNLFGKSLRYFSPDSRVRKFCYVLVTNSLFNQFFTFLIVTQIMLLTIQQWDVKRGYVYNHGYTYLDWILFVYYVFYTIEMIMKIIAFGLYDDSQTFIALKLQKHKSLLKIYYSKWKKQIGKSNLFGSKRFYRTFKKKSDINNEDYRPKRNPFLSEQEILQQKTVESDDPRVTNEPIHTVTIDNPSSKSRLHRAYIRTSWNQIDFISICCFWISFFLSLNMTDIGKYQVFRSLMCLKILRMLNISNGTRTILKSLKDAALQSRQVSLFLVCFWILFGIIGVESFKSSLRRQCVWTNPSNESDTFINTFQFCGSYLDPLTRKALPYINSDGTSSTRIKGFTCPVNSKCITGENPYGGSISFDNVAQSMELVFVILSANTFTDLMYYAMDSDSMVSSLFFIICIFILTVWLLSLIVAVIINSYTAQAEKQKLKKEEGIEHFLKTCQNHYNNFVADSKLIQQLQKFNFVFVTLILISFIHNCTKSSNMTHDSLRSYNRFDFIISIILLIEIVIRFGAFVLAHNWRIFFYSTFNCIDLFLAIATLVISLPPTYERMDITAYGWFSFFSISRFYRVVKSFNFLKHAWASVFTRSKPLIELSLFGTLTIYLVSIIMSRLFEGIVPESELADGDQWIMHNLPNCLISLYIITSTENWTTILYTTQEHASNTFTRFCVAVYLLMWFLFSNTVLLSIFIAIITDNMGVPEIEKRHKQIKHFYKQCVTKLKNDENQGFFDLIRYKLNKTSSLSSEFSTEEMVNRMKILMRQNNGIGLEDDEDDEYEKRSLMGTFFHWCFQRLKGVPFYEEAQMGVAYLWKKYKYKKNQSGMEADFDDQQNRSTSMNQINNEDSNILQNQESNTSGIFGNDNQEHRRLLFSTFDKRKNQIDRSLYIFPNDNAIRRFCQKLVSPSSGKRIEGATPIPWAKHLFSIVMFIASVVVVILACYLTPLYREQHNLNNGYYHWTVYQDTVFMSLFTIEFLIKIIADGLLFGNTAYSKSTWNKLDFIVLISFWVTFLSVILGNYSLLITFGALKALRGFRLLTITKDSQHYFEIAIISGARKILTAAFISLSLLIPFSLWGLNIFSGRLSYCLDGVSNSSNCSLEYSNTVYSWEVLSPNVYTEPNLHFNTFRSSIESLFEIVSLEGWTDLLANVMNISKYGEPPKIFASPGNGVFVTIFNFVSIVLILNLFISVIINNYSIQTGIAYLTEAQHSWYEVRRVLSQVKPSKRKNENELGKFQHKIYNQLIQKNGVWTKVIALLLIAHLSLLLAEVYPFKPRNESIRSGFFIITTFGLFLHMLLLQYALGTKLFYANNWNTYRILIVFISLVLSCVYQAFPAADAFTNIYKAFLVSILFFIIPEVDTLNQLLKFGSAGLPSLVSLIYTWLVLFIVFAIALNQLFGLTRLGENTSGNLNARTVTKALIMLFRSSFGEGWNYTMMDFAISKPYCYDAGFGKSDCGNQTVALFLFIVWNILSMYIFLNILISVVINNFSYVFHGSSPHKLLTRDEIRKFKIAWNKYDPYGTGFILVQQLQPMLSSLNGVLSYKIYGEHFSIPRITKVWVKQNGDSPYDIELDFKRLDEVFALINFKKVKSRKFRFNRLVLEAVLTSVETENGRRIRFNDLLLQVGYYSRFKDSTCLKLEDFLKRSVLLKKINQELRNRKVYSTIQMVVTRLRYKIYVKDTNIIASIDTSNDYEKKAIKDNVCVLITGKDIPFGSSDVWQQNEDPFNPFNPFNNDQLYRSVSKNSLNPFSDDNAALNNSSRDSMSSGFAL